MDPILSQSLVALVLGFLISAILGRWLVPALRRWKAGQAIKEDGPTWHMSKQGTPTMGGLMFIAAVVVAVLVLNGPAIAAGDLTSVFVLLLALVFGFIGFLDDYAKIKKKENTGLTASQKFLLQLAAAILFIVLLRNQGILSPNLYVPFFGVEWKLPWVVYMIFAALVITGTVNAVNITDGIDGLSSSVTLPVCAFFAVSFGYAYLHWNRPGSAGMAVFAASLFGGLVGFLIYNFYPAKVFMGDTGSLFLGGAVCGMAFALDLAAFGQAPGGFGLGSGFHEWIWHERIPPNSAFPSHSAGKRPVTPKKARMQNTSEMPAKTNTTFFSLQPPISRWWWRGAMRKIRLPWVALK